MATKVLALRRDDCCVVCSSHLAAGKKAEWDSVARVVTCMGCLDSGSVAPTDAAVVGVGAPLPLDVGDPGRSARDEHARRRARHEAKIEQRWGSGRLGKIAKALSDEPQSTRAWAQGASGEEQVARTLHERLGDRAVLLHDRRVPGARGNIDHLAIAASGVWVIDAKKYKGKVEKRDVGRWFKTDMRLYVGGRDRTKTVEGLRWQVEAVRSALSGERVRIRPAVCFVDAEWPGLLGKPMKMDDVWISRPRKLAELIAETGDLCDEDIERVARQLAQRLPSK